MEALLERASPVRHETTKPRTTYIPLAPSEVQLEMPVRINGIFEGDVVHAFDNGKFINVAPHESQTVSGLRMIVPNVDTIEHIVTESL